MAQIVRSNTTYLYSGTVSKRVSALCEALPQIIAIFIKITLGFSTILIVGLANTHENGMLVSQEELSWVGSISLICVRVGCNLSELLSTKLEKRKGMQLDNILLTMTW